MMNGQRHEIIRRGGMPCVLAAAVVVAGSVLAGQAGAQTEREPAAAPQAPQPWPAPGAAGGDSKLYLVPFNTLPADTQRLFREKVEDFVWIDKTLWSCEVAHRFEKISARYQADLALAPYQEAGAPLWYDPVGRRAAASAQEALARTPGVVNLQGRVVRTLADGMLVQLTELRGRATVNTVQVFVVRATADMADKQNFTALAQRDGVYQPTTPGSKKQAAEIPRYRPAAELVRPAQPEEVYEYFVRNQVHGFPDMKPTLFTGMLRPSNAIGGDKYVWYDRAAALPLPPLRPALPPEP